MEGEVVVASIAAFIAAVALILNGIQHSAAIKFQSLDHLERVSKEISLQQQSFVRAWMSGSASDQQDARTDFLNYLEVVAMGVEEKLYTRKSRKFAQDVVLSCVAALEHITGLHGIEKEVHSAKTWVNLTTLVRNNRTTVNEMRAAIGSNG